MSDNTNSVPLLTMENYFSWKTRVLSIIKAKSVRAEQIATGVSTAPATPELMEEWQQADAIAVNIIKHGLDEVAHSMVATQVTSREVMTQLDAVYGQVQYSTKLSLQSEFDQLEQGNMTVNEFINKVISLQARLASMNMQPTADRVMKVLVWGLGPRFDGWRHVLLNSIDDWMALSGPDPLVVNKIIGKIRNADIQMSAIDKRRGGDGKEAAMATQTVRSCTFCKKTGHTADYCFINPASPKYRKELVGNGLNKRSGKKRNDKGKKKEKGKAEGEEWASVVSNVQATYWMVDSGATAHMTFCKEDFTLLHERPLGITGTADGTVHEVKGVGEVCLTAIVDGKKVPRRLTNVKWVPGLRFRLFSVERTIENGLLPDYSNHTFKIVHAPSSTTIFESIKHGKARFLKCTAASYVERSLVTTQAVDVNYQIWHQRLGHIAEKAVKLTINTAHCNHTVPSRRLEAHICKSCLIGGQTRFSFQPKANLSLSKTLSLVHSDVVGPLPLTPSGQRYFVTFIEDHTGYARIYTLKQKSDVNACFQAYLPFAERASDKQLKVLRTDGGGEYVNHEMNAYLTSKGIEHEITVPRTPQQNGVAERLNRTLLEMVRAMMDHASAPTHFWAEALQLAVWIHNRVPRKMGKSPYHLWYKQAPDIAPLRTFGCLAYAANTASHKSKLEDRSRPLVFIGFADRSKGWRFYDMNTKTMVRSADVIFDESVFPFAKVANAHSPAVEGATHALLHPFIQARSHLEIEPGQMDPDGEAPSDSSSELSSAPDVSDEEVEAQLATSRTRPTLYPNVARNSLHSSPVRNSLHQPTGTSRERHPPSHLRDYAAVVFALASTDDSEDLQADPLTIEEARQRSDWPRWEESIRGEYQNHQQNGTWVLCLLPKGRVPIGAKWVLHIKHNGDGTIDKYKARLVARGFTQREGIDFKETFSPVVRSGTIRLVLAIAAMHNWPIHQADVVAAYLNGALQEEIYMIQPPGMEDGTNRVCRLVKGLYGLKQSGRVWYRHAHDHLKKMGFKCLDSDQGLYIRKKPCIAIICLYVDDMIITAESQEEIDGIKQEFHREFKIVDGGPLAYILGIQVNRTKDAVEISQETYIKKIAERFGLANANPVLTPLPSGFSLQQADDAELLAPSMQKVYQSIIGAVMYAAMGTRVDVAFSAQLLSRRLSKPTQAHYLAARHLLRYLKGTASFSLKYARGKSNDPKLTLYCDADYAGDKDSAKSTSGLLAVYNQGIITWMSRRQECVALSTLEAEYIALCEAAKEATWMRDILDQFSEPQKEPTVIYADNQGANAFSQDTQFHRRTKHINVRYHYIREKVQDKTVQIQYVHTDKQKADILTKPLQRIKHLAAVVQLNLKKISAEREC